MALQVWGLFPENGILRKAYVESDGTFAGWASAPIEGVTVPTEHVPRITAFCGHPTLSDLVWWADTDEAGHANLYKSNGVSISLVATVTANGESGITQIYVEASAPHVSVWFSVGRVSDSGSINTSRTGQGVYHNTDDDGEAFIRAGDGTVLAGAPDDDYPGIQSVEIDESSGAIWTACGRQEHDRIIARSTDSGGSWVSLGPGPDSVGQCQGQLLWMIPRRGPMSAIRYQSSQLGNTWLLFNLDGFIGPGSGKIGLGGFFRADPNVGIWASFPQTGASGSLRRTTNGGVTVTASYDWAGAGANVQFGEGATALHRLVNYALFVDNSGADTYVTPDGGATWAVFEYPDYTRSRDVRWWWLETGIGIINHGPGTGLRVTWVDEPHGERDTYLIGRSNPVAVLDHLEAHSRVDWREYVQFERQRGTPPGQSGEYASVDDRAIIIGHATSGIVQFEWPMEVPAPVAGMFASNGWQVATGSGPALDLAIGLVAYGVAPGGAIPDGITTGFLLRLGQEIRPAV